MKNTFRVCLTGGLGNQFFQIAAGLYASKKSDLKYEFIESFDQFSKYNHENEIEFFPRIKLLKRSHRASKTGALIYRAKRKASIKSKLASRILKIDVHQEVGYVGELNNIRAGWQLQGHYQSFKYLNEVKSETQELLAVDNPSPWLKEMRKKANAELPISLHIRRGDYVTLSDQHGLLTHAYYDAAISATKTVLPNSPIWVFSDDIDSARKILKEIEANFLFINPEANSPAAESLALMWECQGHIIANSTFSWWGSALAKSNKITIAPYPWMKNGNVVSDLYPSTWILKDAAY